MHLHTKGNGLRLKRSQILKSDFNFPSFKGYILYNVHVTFFQEHSKNQMKIWIESGDDFWTGSGDKSRAKRKCNCLKEERGVFSLGRTYRGTYMEG